MAQTVKNLPAMQETQVRSLGWEDTLEKGIVQYSCLENSMTREAWRAIVYGVTKEMDMSEQKYFHKGLSISVYKLY